MKVKKVTVIDLQNVYFAYDDKVILEDINIPVEAGDFTALIGPNGAGKTTLFNMLTGESGPSSGTITLYTADGPVDITKKKAYQVAKLGVARTFQNIRLFGDLTVYDNILTACQKNIHYNFFQGILHTKKCKEYENTMVSICNKVLDDVGLTHYKNQKANNLPYGMQRRLEIARALVTNPKLLLLDEPAAGMNEEESDSLSYFIKEIQDKNDITVIIIDHHMDVIMKICDRISVLNFGTLLAEGVPKEIQSNNEVIEAYLGVDE